MSSVNVQIEDMLEDKYGIRMNEQPQCFIGYDSAGNWYNPIRYQNLLQMAVDIAIISAQNGAGPFGAIVAESTTRIFSYGYNKVISINDSTQHAEIVAIREAQSLEHSHTLQLGSRSVNLYCSCRPCIQCMGAVWWSGIKDVYYYNVQEQPQRLGFDEGPQNETFWEILKESFKIQKQTHLFAEEDESGYAKIPFEIYEKLNGRLY